MDQEFWDERWTSGRIAFHQPTPNQFLMSHWRNLGLSGGDSVFVPLCGKSLDMVWLAQAGHRVVGVEFNQLAVDAFFEENNLSRTVSERDGFTVCSGENIEIWCGDFFALPAAAPWMKPLRMSIGSGNTMVLVFSVEISASVWR